MIHHVAANFTRGQISIMKRNQLYGRLAMSTETKEEFVQAQIEEQKTALPKKLQWFVDNNTNVAQKDFKPFKDTPLSASMLSEAYKTIVSCLDKIYYASERLGANMDNSSLYRFDKSLIALMADFRKKFVNNKEIFISIGIIYYS